MPSWSSRRPPEASPSPGPRRIVVTKPMQACPVCESTERVRYAEQPTGLPKLAYSDPMWFPNPLTGIIGAFACVGCPKRSSRRVPAEVR